jgi:FixJ family two-component response regulator
VDDEPGVCQALADALDGPGLKAIGATSGAEALDAARDRRPDVIVADLRLGDCTGLELIDRLRGELGDIPAVIVSGHGSAAAFADASSRRPVELFNKPVDPDRLRKTVRSELERLQRRRRRHDRQRRFRTLVRRAARRRKETHDGLAAACAELTATCRQLQGRLDRQEALIRYQAELVSCANEDDTFSRLFRLFVQRTGPVFGVALLCDEKAELQMVGRFGVPVPDGANFCRTLAMATVDTVLERPQTRVLDAQDHLHLFPSHIHRMLVGVTLLLVPLMVGPGQLIGLAVLYRKGEQPFTNDDVALADMVAPSTAAAAQRS